MAAVSRILGAVAALLVLAGGALAQQPTFRQQLDGARVQLQQAEAALQRPSLDDAALADLKARVEPIGGLAATIIAEETPRLEAIAQRIEQFGPKPEAGKAPPESAEVTKEREEQEKHRQEADEILRSARLVAVTVDQIVAQIVDRRRSLFAKAVLEQSRGLLSPWLWSDVAGELPRELRVAGFVVNDWFQNVLTAQLDTPRMVALGMLALVVVVGFTPALRLTRRFARQDEEVEAPSRLQVATAALRLAVVYAALPLVLALVGYQVVMLLNLAPGRFEPLARALFGGLAIIGLARGLASGILAVDKPGWRFVAVDQRTAESLRRMATLVPTIVALGKMADAVNQIIIAGLPLTAATRGVFAVLAALAVIQVLRGIESRHEEAAAADEAALGPRAPGSDARGLPLRLAGWIAALGVIGSAVLGYIALASFIVDQALWIIMLGIVVMLLVSLIDEGIGKGLGAEGRLGRHLRGATGLTRGAVDQIGILSAGLMRLLLFVIAAFLVLAPWGFDSSDVLGSVKTAFFGFQIGDVTISLSAVATAVALFGVGTLITRSLKRWLEQSYLPHTALDIGLRNSIGTVFGYAGMLVAVAIALGQLGISLDKITIVAGALSVGIGFGLQSIVNNFVSGLILLWERPLRVGDWIVVGEEQGKVRRINVRATEIETFDKASLIVPNSEFISGRVKNFVHNDRTGRIVIPVGVTYDANPDDVRAILTDVALSHREVFTLPKPVVVFKAFGDSTLNFELICFADVDALFTVRSDLMYDLFRRLKAAGIEIPFPRRTVEIGNLAEFGTAIAAKVREDISAPPRPALPGVSPTTAAE